MNPEGKYTLLDNKQTKVSDEISLSNKKINEIKNLNNTDVSKIADIDIASIYEKSEKKEVKKQTCNIYKDHNKSIHMCYECKDLLINTNKIIEWDTLREIVRKYYLKEDSKFILFGENDSDLDILLKDYSTEGKNYENESKNHSMNGKCNIF